MEVNGFFEGHAQWKSRMPGGAASRGGCIQWQRPRMDVSQDETLPALK